MSYQNFSTGRLGSFEGHGVSNTFGNQFGQAGDVMTGIAQIIAPLAQMGVGIVVAQQQADFAKQQLRAGITPDAGPTAAEQRAAAQYAIDVAAAAKKAKTKKILLIVIVLAVIGGGAMMFMMKKPGQGQYGPQYGPVRPPRPPITFGQQGYK